MDLLVNISRWGSVLLLCASSAVAATDVERHVDSSGAFSYALPEGWQTQKNPRLPHEVVIMPSTDGKVRNIMINDQRGTSSLEVLKGKYEIDLPKALKNYHLVESKLIELEGKRPAVRIIHTNTSPGIPVRQINFILDLGAARYFVSGTVLADDGDKYDEQIEEFVTSMQAERS